MASAAAKKRVGAMIVLMALAAAAVLAVVISVTLRDPRDRYFIRFQESVSGLELGSHIRMLGVHVGQVEQIDVSDDAENVIVTVALAPDTPVPADARAVLSTIGVTGLKYIELTGGTAQAPRIEPNTRSSIIKAGPSRLGQLRRNARRIADKIGQLGHNLAELSAEAASTRSDRFGRDVAALGAAIKSIRDDSKHRARRIPGRIDATTAQMERASRAVSRVRGEARTRARYLMATARRTSTELDQLAQGLRFEPVQGAIRAAAGAVAQQMKGSDLARVGRRIGAAFSHLEGIAAAADASAERRSRQWSQVKGNLRRAGFFLKELAAKVGM